MEQSVLQQVFEFVSAGRTELLIVLIGFGVASATVIQFIFRNPFRSNRIFYSEPSSSEDSDLNKRLKDLEKETKRIRSEIKDDIFKNTREKLDAEVNSYLDGNLEELTEKKLTSNRILEKEIMSSFESKLLSKLDSYLTSLDENQIESMKLRREAELRKRDADEQLRETLEQERKSAGLLKSVMINLFIIVNLGLLFLYLIIGGDINQYTAISISGLYISLAAFIIYIFRASNARTSVLLSIKEDAKNQLSANDYVTNLKNNGELSETDIDYIRLILSNYSEREKSAKHPYEVILKGVSDSNIQFRGGKMSLGQTESSNK